MHRRGISKLHLISSVVHVLVLCGMPQADRERAEEGKGQAFVLMVHPLCLTSGKRADSHLGLGGANFEAVN